MYPSYMDNIAVQKLKIYSKLFARTFIVFKNSKECQSFVLNTIIWYNVKKKEKGPNFSHPNKSLTPLTFLKSKVLETQNSYS